MLLIKTRLGFSGVHGVGLFANQFIPKDTVTWKYHPIFDTAFSEEEIAEMSEPSRKQVYHYAYYDKTLDKYVLPFDDQRFINHSKNRANILSTPDEDVAARDIQQGEELLCDYNGFDETYFTRHGLKEEELID